MEIKTIGEVKVDINVLEDFLIKTDAKDISGEIYICELAAKKELHPKYMKNPYKNNRQYRAYSYPPENKVFIFINEGETMESLLWLLAHELSHHNIRQNKYLKKCCNVAMSQLLASKNITWDEFIANYDVYVADDNFHDSILEEQICNAFATSLVGYDFGRKWWKEQLEELDKKIA